MPTEWAPVPQTPSEGGLGSPDNTLGEQRRMPAKGDPRSINKQRSIHGSNALSLLEEMQMLLIVMARELGLVETFSNCLFHNLKKITTDERQRSYLLREFTDGSEFHVGPYAADDHGEQDFAYDEGDEC